MTTVTSAPPARARTYFGWQPEKVAFMFGMSAQRAVLLIGAVLAAVWPLAVSRPSLVVVTWPVALVLVAAAFVRIVGRTTDEWVEWSGTVNTTIAPVNSPQTLADDPQFQDRLGFLSHETHGADMIPHPVKFVDGSLPDPTPAPTAGQHTDEILGELD